MKLILALKIIPVFILFFSCRKDPVQLYNTCDHEISEESKAYFMNDAMELTLRQTNSDSLSPFYSNPQINEQLLQHILGKLSAIYNAAMDTSTVFSEIINEYHIHVHQTYSFDHLSIKFSDTTLENEFVSNPGSTSSPILNSIANDYAFNSSFDFSGFYFLYSNNNYNIPALCDMLKTEPRIQYASPNGFCCDGDNIEYNWTEQYDEFVFDLGIGDCPSGCFGHHFWKIHVDENCIVTFIEEYGSPLPG